MPIESDEDLASFFDTDDFAVECVVNGPNSFTTTLNVIFDPLTEQVAVYETNVEAPAHHFMCRTVDLLGVKRGMTATVQGVAYTIERIAINEPSVATVYLKK